MTTPDLHVNNCNITKYSFILYVTGLGAPFIHAYTLIFDVLLGLMFIDVVSEQYCLSVHLGVLSLNSPIGQMLGFETCGAAHFRACGLLRRNGVRNH